MNNKFNHNFFKISIPKNIKINSINSINSNKSINMKNNYIKYNNPNYISSIRKEFKEKFPAIKNSLDNVEHIEIEELLIDLYKNYPYGMDFGMFEVKCLKQDIREIIYHKDANSDIISYCIVFMSRHIREI